MAKVTIARGHVARVFDVRGVTTGVGLEERYEDRNGNQRATRYSVFYDEPHGLEAGDVIKIEGLLSASVDTYAKQDGTPAHSVSLKINKPKHEVLEKLGSSNLEQMANQIFDESKKVGHAAVNQVWPEVSSAGKTETLENAPF